MSSREHLYKIAGEAFDANIQDRGCNHLTHSVARWIVDALLPEIRGHRQMIGVPEGSILIVPVMNGVVAVRWSEGLLHGDLKADRMPMDPKWVIEHYGPLTVVWMP